MDAYGRTLWDGPALEVAGAEPAVVVASDGVVDEPEARRALAEQSGAAVVDMESGVLASTGRLAGVVRAISDSGEQPVGRLVCARQGRRRHRLEGRRARRSRPSRVEIRPDCP